MLLYLFLDDEWVGRSSEKFPRTSGWRSVERGAEHFGFRLGPSKEMPWLVRIAGMKETRRTVQVRMVVVIHPAPCRLEPRSSLVTSLLQWGEPRGCTRYPLEETVTGLTKKLKNEVTYLVGLRLSRALSKTNDKVEFCLGVYVILGGGGKEKVCSALFRRAAHWSHFSIQDFRGLRLQYS